MSREGMTNEELFREACNLVHRNHGKKTANDSVGTLNRLFNKHLDGLENKSGEERVSDFIANCPRLTHENTRTTCETRPKLDWARLVRKPEMPPRSLSDNDISIVVLRIGGYEGILDGSNRCRLWLRNNDQGKHEALVVCPNLDGGQPVEHSQ